jgi:hypothetical protein
MELKVSVSEAIALIKEVENVPAKILEYIGMNITEGGRNFYYKPYGTGTHPSCGKREI